MHYQEFSKRIKEKYPQYNDIDDRELATKIVAKYPQYQVDFDDNRVAPQTVSTPQGTNNSSPIYPQVEQSPVVENKQGFWEGFSNVLAHPIESGKALVDMAVVQPTKSLVGTAYNTAKLFQDPKYNLREQELINSGMSRQDAMKEVSKLAVNDAKNILQSNPLMALGAGAVKGTVELPQDVQNIVAGIQGSDKKWNYTDKISNAIASNNIVGDAYKDYVLKPMENNPALSMLGEFAGVGAGVTAPIKGAVKAIKLNKLEKAIKAEQVAKYNAYMPKTIKAEAQAKLAKEAIDKAKYAKAHPIKNLVKKMPENVALGAGLGALEGENIEDRMTNAGAGTAFGVFAPFVAEGAKATVKGAGKVAKPINTKYNNWLDGTTGDSSVVASNGAGELRKFEVKTSKSGKQTLESILVDENGNTIGKQPNIQNLDALKAKYKTNNVEDIIKYEHSNKGFYDSKTDTFDVNNTDTTILESNKTAKEPNWIKNKLANTHASFNNAIGIKSSPSKLVTKYMNVDNAVARRNAPTEMKLRSDQVAEIKGYKNLSDLEAKATQVSAQTGIPIEVVLEKMYNGTWKDASTYLKENRNAKIKEKVDRINQERASKEVKSETIVNDDPDFFQKLLEEENKEFEQNPSKYVGKEKDVVSTAPVSEVSNPVDINTPKLEGTAVKTHELPASVNPKKSYKEKIAGQQEVIEQQGGVKASDPSKLNIDIKSQIEAKRRSKPRSFVVEKSGDNTYFHGEDGVSKVYNKNGKSAYVAEGARDLSKRTVGEENIYERYDELFEKPEEGVSKRYLREGIHETSVDQPVYQYAKNESPEFMKWYDEYSKADSKTKNKMLSEKLKSYKTQDEASKFYEKFSEQEMMGNQAKRAKKVGDETYDTADVSEAERLTKVIEEEDIQYGKAESEIDVHSSGFRKLLEASWDKMPRGKTKNAKTYIKGKLNAWRESADFQKEYDKIVKQLSGKGFSPKIQEAMLSDINAIADSVIESKKKFGVTYKKTRNITQNIYNQLVEANKTGQLAKGKQIIDSNNLKHKYVDENMKNALKEHYIDSVEKANAKLNAMGVEKNAQGEYVFNQEKAIEWAKNESRSKYKNNPRKLAKDLNLLEKSPEVALERAKNAINKIISANKNIIANDTRFAFEAPQKKLKEISAKGDQQRWKVEETGDTWDRKSSDVDAGERLANKATTTLENIYNRDLGKEYIENRSKSISKVIEDIDKMTTKEIIDAWDKYGKDLDQHYMNNSGKDSIPVSELPSTKYFEAKKRVDTIKSFDESVKANSELKAGKISNKDYAEFGTDENLKQYAKDYPDSEIIVESSKDINDGGGFDTTTENLHIYDNYNGSYSREYIIKHEVGHSQQWKDPRNIELFLDLQEKTNARAKAIQEHNKIWNDVARYCKEHKIKLERKKNGEVKKVTINKLLKNFQENEINNFLDVLYKDDAYRDHPLEVGANNYAKGGSYEPPRTTNGQMQLRSDRGISKGDFRLGSRGNSKGKMDEANAEAKSIQEEKVVKFVENEFNKEHLPQTAQEKTKAQKAIDTNSQEFKASLARCKDAISASKLVSENTEQLYIERGMLDSEQATRALIKRGAKKKDAFYLPSGKKEIESGSIFDPAEDGTWSKENWTGGRKKFDGLNTDAKFSDVAKSNIARNLYANDVNNAVNMVRNEFAIPFKKDGTVPNGYMAVNENLLYKVAHAKGGIEMYNTMTEGGAKLKQFMGNDQKMFEQWDKLLEKDRVPDYLLPKEAVMKLLDGTGETPNQYKARYFGQGNDWRYYPKLAGAITDASLARIKMGMLGTVKFISNNLRTSAKMSFLAGSPKDFFRAVLDRRFLRNEDIPSGVVEDAFFEAERRSRHKKLDTGIDAIDNFFNLLNGHDIDPTKYKRLVEGKDIKTNQKTTAYIDTNASKAVEVANKLNGLNKLTINIADGLFKLNSKIEREFRKIEYAKRLNANLKNKVKHTANRMYTIREMVKAVKENPELESVIVSQIEDVYGNYHSFNQLEKGALRRIFPFYAWDRVLYRNTRFMWEKNIDKWAIAKAMMLRRQVQNDDPEKHPVLSNVLLANHKDKPLVQYQRKANRTNLYNKTTGGHLINNNTSADAYMDDLIGLPEDIPAKVYSKMNPQIKHAVDTIRGHKDYNMGFETGRYKSSYDGKYKDGKTGEKVELPATERAKYFAQKEIGGIVYPYSKNSLPGLAVAHVRAIPHAMKTGEWRLPDKAKDVGFGGLYIGEVDQYGNKVYGKNNVDYKYQIANAVATSYTNPTYDKKKQKEKWQKQSRKLRGY